MREHFTGGTPWLIVINPAGTVVFNNYLVDSDKLIEFVAENIAITRSYHSGMRQLRLMDTLPTFQFRLIHIFTF